MVVTAVDDGIGKLEELLLKALVVAFLPHILKHTVDVHLVDAEAVKMQHALADIRNVGTADGHLSATIGELLEPQRDIAHHVIV